MASSCPSPRIAGSRSFLTMWASETGAVRRVRDLTGPWTCDRTGPGLHEGTLVGEPNGLKAPVGALHETPPH